MNRRDFIKKSSVAGTGGLVLAGLPLPAASLLEPKKQRVILCVIAGISRDDFATLFPRDSAIRNNGKLLSDLRYNGEAAGHRLALESIMNGSYVSEKEAGKKLLCNADCFPLFKNNYLISQDRFFLTHGEMTAKKKASHFLLSYECSISDRPGIIHQLPIIKALSEKYPNEANEVLSNSTAAGIVSKGKNESADELVTEASCSLIMNSPVDTLVIHYMGADAAHENMSQAKKNIDHIRYGIKKLWELTSIYVDDTLFIAISDFGRNSFANSIKDENGAFATDHTISDENVRNISCFIAHTRKLPKTNHIKESIDIFELIKT